MGYTPRVSQQDGHKQSLDFGGVPGNLMMTIGLPVFTAYLYFAVRFNGGAPLPGPESDWAGFFAALKPTWEAAFVYLAWVGLQAAFQLWLPGKVVQGTELPGGGRLDYKMNGPASLVASFLIVGAGHAAGVWDIAYIADNFGALLSVMTISAYAMSVWLYFYGKRVDDHSTGVLIHDFWMGTGRNPRLPQTGIFDLKFFFEARPGLILWILVDFSFAAVQYREYGFVSTAMALVCVLQALYVIDYFANEPAILTTMDIKHENFGLMLAFGDMVWVPMTYSLQAAYLVHHVHDLPWWAAVGIALMAVTGLMTFRAVNNQKNKFRLDPDNAVIWGKKAEYIQTEHGSKLLLSGFWGWSRHFNYVGDELMAMSWSMPCGFASPIPWFYPVYFAILLIHRQIRDDEHCEAKYGEDWLEYKKRVPWRIIPGIY